MRLLSKSIAILTLLVTGITQAQVTPVKIRLLSAAEMEEYAAISGQPKRGWEVWEKGGVFTLIMSEQRSATSSPEFETRHIFAYCGLNDHGGLLPMFRMRDFANEVYWPEFIYEESGPADMDNDGRAEYYLAYHANSDGLDAKPLKVLVYWNFKKYKATAYYPAGNLGDRYRIEYDVGWQRLPKPVAQKAESILAKLNKSDKR
ncbi:MAG TPA: hypothetical protein VEC35_18400 [Noviherbaspirillum sp.]|nr:hypothetical protein [Noviherbaspirillum sp.]